MVHWTMNRFVQLSLPLMGDQGIYLAFKWLPCLSDRGCYEGLILTVIGSMVFLSFLDGMICTYKNGPTVLQEIK
jgi:hypothetical protein